ncbi:hypothetical protein BMF94_0044 [Rhodotorula taiwanensis]|uniref:Uncharacterized protein n=1 Tax=Rhodotorula taiwanensis TaxID=741276 RepID=A0A2S5BJ49_9BASI|nr:hypothetical protein BMF94_0044 [Rhodotorula taiwanensis]
MAGLFARPQGEEQRSRQSSATQTLFLQLKAICVPLLEVTKGPTVASTLQQATQLLVQLQAKLEQAKADDFSAALANYAFFPLAALLRPPLDGRTRGDAVLEATMNALAALVVKWRAVGMDARVRQELWIMTTLTLGGPLDPNKPVDTKGKGKAVEMTDEARLAMVRVLVALLRPFGDKVANDADDDDPLGERLDWSKVDANDPSTFSNGVPQADADPLPPTPILFHTLTTLLGLAAEPTSLLPLQLSSLEALRILISQYLAQPVDAAGAGAGATVGPSPLLATALPGTASTLSRIATSRPKKALYDQSATPDRPQASKVVASALETLSLVIVETVGDAATGPLRSMRDGRLDGSVAVVASLEEFVLDSKHGDPAPDEHEASEEPVPPVAEPTPTAQGPTVPTADWLRYTVSSLELLFVSLSPVAAHESPLVRAALVDLLDSVLRQCRATLAGTSEQLVEALLVLSADEWTDLVALPARAALGRALDGARDTTEGRTEATEAREMVLRIVRRRFAALPGSLRRRDEVGAQRCAKVVRVAFELLVDSSAEIRTSFGGIFKDFDKSSWSLLSAIELERVSTGGPRGSGGMALAWITGSGVNDGTPEDSAYPPVRLRRVTEEATVASLQALWQALGHAAAVTESLEAVVQHLLGFPLGPRRADGIAVSALSALDDVMTGARMASSTKSGRKTARTVVKTVIALLDELRSRDEPGGEPAETGDAQVALSSGEEQPIEHRIGVLDIPSLEAYAPVATRQTRDEDRASHDLSLVSWSLRLLATCAVTLGSAFQRHLMEALYHVLEHSSPTSHPFVAAHARQALNLISAATAYASPQNLVLANVDYVVNSVSQRLSVSHLDPQAPLVLVEMIRLVGSPIVPMVQDLVDDVFEALDDYHGYDEITVGLWAVLDALLKVMEEDLPSGDQQTGKLTLAPESAQESWSSLEAWLADRTVTGPEDAPDAALDPDDTNPQRPFAEADQRDMAEEPAEQPTDQVTPPSRTQVVTAQILSKALYFLSHESAFLRARVLSLIASAVPLLTRPSLDAADPTANRASDLMPVIHRAWPYVLNRLSDSEPYVIVEAAGLVESLSRHVGEYMSRRIVDDVWPRFKELLDRMAADSQTTAISSGDPHSTAHRIQKSVLRTLQQSSARVPIKEEMLWDVAMTTRHFLGCSAHPDLQQLAAQLFRNLRRLNDDIIWLILAGSAAADKSLPRFLRMDALVGSSVVDGLLAE